MGTGLWLLIVVVILYVGMCAFTFRFIDTHCPYFDMRYIVEYSLLWFIMWGSLLNEHVIPEKRRRNIALLNAKIQELRKLRATK